MRLVSDNATFSVGGQAYYIGLHWIGQQLDLCFDTDDQLLVCRSEKVQLVKRFPLCGVTINSLLGQLEFFTTLPTF